MSIESTILEFLKQPTQRKYRRYKGVPVGMFGLPVFSVYNERSIYNAFNNLKKKKYVVFTGTDIRVTEEGNKYYAKRKARLQMFDSPFEKNAPKKLILMFDVPEARKAEREWLRRQLGLFGYSMIQKSVWVGPSPLPLEFKSYLERIKLDGHLKSFTLARPYQTKSALE